MQKILNKIIIIIFFLSQHALHLGMILKKDWVVKKEHLRMNF